MYKLSNVFSFQIPGSVSMLGIVALYVELCLYSFIIVYIIIDIMFGIIVEFSEPYFEERRLLKQEGRRLQPMYFTHQMESFLDIFFLILPTSIIVYLLVPTLGFLYNNELSGLQTAFTINIIAHQWYWSYEYCISSIYNNIFDLTNDVIHVDKILFDSNLIESNINRLLTVDNTLIIPSNVIINCAITSVDVIHAWAVPQLGIKVDAVPGRVNNVILTTFMESIFTGQCSELCGVKHGFMPIVVESVPVNQFMDWIGLHVQQDYISLFWNNLTKTTGTEWSVFLACFLKTNYKLEVKFNKKRFVRNYLYRPKIVGGNSGTYSKSDLLSWLNNNYVAAHDATITNRILLKEILNKNLKKGSENKQILNVTDLKDISAFRRDIMQFVDNMNYSIASDRDGWWRWFFGSTDSDTTTFILLEEKNRLTRMLSEFIDANGQWIPEYKIQEYLISEEIKFNQMMEIIKVDLHANIKEEVFGNVRYLKVLTHDDKGVSQWKYFVQNISKLSNNDNRQFGDPTTVNWDEALTRLNKMTPESVVNDINNNNLTDMEWLLACDQQCQLQQYYYDLIVKSTMNIKVPHHNVTSNISSSIITEKMIDLNNGLRAKYHIAEMIYNHKDWFVMKGFCTSTHRYEIMEALQHNPVLTYNFNYLDGSYQVFHYWIEHHTLNSLENVTSLMNAIQYAFLSNNMAKPKPNLEVEAIVENQNSFISIIEGCSNWIRKIFGETISNQIVTPKNNCIVDFFNTKQKIVEDVYLGKTYIIESFKNVYAGTPNTTHKVPGLLWNTYVEYWSNFKASTFNSLGNSNTIFTQAKRILKTVDIGVVDYSSFSNIVIICWIFVCIVLFMFVFKNYKDIWSITVSSFNYINNFFIHVSKKYLIFNRVTLYKSIQSLFNFFLKWMYYFLEKFFLEIVGPYGLTKKLYNYLQKYSFFEKGFVFHAIGFFLIGCIIVILVIF